jgi:hypothetical protein
LKSGRRLAAADLADAGGDSNALIEERGCCPFNLGGCILSLGGGCTHDRQANGRVLALIIHASREVLDGAIRGDRGRLVGSAQEGERVEPCEFGQSWFCGFVGADEKRDGLARRGGEGGGQ